MKEIFQIFLIGAQITACGDKDEKNKFTFSSNNKILFWWMPSYSYECLRERHFQWDK